MADYSNYQQEKRCPERLAYIFNYKPQQTGTYAFFATYPNHTDHLGNHSPQKSFKVVR